MGLGYTSATGEILFTVRRFKYTQFVVFNSPRSLTAERVRAGDKKRLITRCGVNRMALRNDLIGMITRPRRSDRL